MGYLFASEGNRRIRARAESGVSRPLFPLLCEATLDGMGMGSAKRRSSGGLLGRVAPNAEPVRGGRGGTQVPGGWGIGELFRIAGGQGPANCLRLRRWRMDDADPAGGLSHHEASLGCVGASELSML
ncbi:unnamed protein product [Ostreobium quekettii]|uniref:Uncharacterized protein n=1 Tax=Ostreobium quekettii TaxID=121088 RepID=A0A8S1J1D7_9CHLO|nr:unnamed protein product [Ostreobium quekettii]